jgi:hypothetical protein
MAEFFRGKVWFLKSSRVSILNSMLNFDWVYDKHFVYREKDETSVASTDQWATRSDSEDLEVRDGLLFGLGNRIYDLS